MNDPIIQPERGFFSHMRRPLCGAVIAYICGILVGRFCQYSAVVYGGWFLLVFIGYMFLRRHRVAASVLLLCLIVISGAVRITAEQEISTRDIQRFARSVRGQVVMVRGVVKSDPREYAFGFSHKRMFEFQLTELKRTTQWVPVVGTVLVNFFSSHPVSYGDRLELAGKFHRPFESTSRARFSYREYLANYGIAYMLSVKKAAAVVTLNDDGRRSFRGYLYAMHRPVKRIFTQYLTKGEAGIMCGLLLGDRTQISRSLTVMFMNTGTVHILSISGLHVAMVAAVGLLFLSLLPGRRKWHYITLVFLLVLYAGLTGGRPPIVRSTIMISVFLLSFLFERQPDTLTTTAFAALVILAVWPRAFFDIGFQLSFLCVLCIILLYPRVYQVLGYVLDEKSSIVTKRVVESVSLSFAVWLGSTGWVLYCFGIITPIAIIANVLVVPISGCVIALGIVLIAVGLGASALAPFCAVCLKFFLNGMVAVVFLLTRIPYGNFLVKDITLWHVAGYYFCLFVIFYLPWRKISGTMKMFFCGRFVSIRHQ